MSILIGQIKVWQGSALPNAAGEHRGKLFQLWGASGAEDGLYACFKKTDDTYAWIKLEDSSGGSTFDAVTAGAYKLSSAGIVTEAGMTRTLSAADNGKVIYCTSSSAVTINCAANLGAGFSVTIIQGGTGKVTVAANGQTLVSYSSLYSTMGQYAVISAMAPVANTFLLAGNLGV